MTGHHDGSDRDPGGHLGHAGPAAGRSRFGPGHAGHNHGAGHDHGPGHAGHDHGNDHGPGHTGHPNRRAGQRSRLRWVLGLTTVFMVVEVVGGLLSGSLALVADAGHMLSDSSAILLSLIALRVGERPPDLRKTYGWGRSEILAALLNGATLVALSGWIVWEAVERIRDPQPVNGTALLGVASVGLIVNLIAAKLLHGHAHDNLNVRGAYLHVLGDLLGSVGALAAGAVIFFTGWTVADPLISVLIAALVLLSAWRLIRDATDVLMEAAPRHIDVDELVKDIQGIEGLSNVHDVHVWAVTPGFVAMSGHGEVEDPTELQRVLDDVREHALGFGISHVTFQLEPRRLYQISTAEAPS